jgi:hypothetical protein
MTATKAHCDSEIYTSFAERHFGTIDGSAATPLSGGLDSCGIYRVDVKLSGSQAGRKARLIAKHLRGLGVREFGAYRALRASCSSSSAPRLLGIHREARDAVCIFLEWMYETRRAGGGRTK